MKYTEEELIGRLSGAIDYLARTRRDFYNLNICEKHFTSEDGRITIGLQATVSLSGVRTEAYSPGTYSVSHEAVESRTRSHLADYIRNGVGGELRALYTALGESVLTDIKAAQRFATKIDSQTISTWTGQPTLETN